MSYEYPGIAKPFSLAAIKNNYQERIIMTFLVFLDELRLLLSSVNNFAEESASNLQKEFDWKTFDTRLYYLNSLSEIAFNHGLTLYFIDTEIASNDSMWKERQNYFKPTREDVFQRILKNYPFQVRDNFFFDFVNLLEHTLRIISHDLIGFKAESISTVKDKLIKELKLDKTYLDLLGITFKIRNTIHNGGLNSKTQQSIIYKGRRFNFIEKSLSESGIDNLNFLFSELMLFMIRLFQHEKSISKPFIKHPYQELQIIQNPR